jgi:hypothetical protein
MAYLKVYSWEHNLYPEEQRTLIRAELRVPLAKALARRFGIRHLNVYQRNRNGGGKAWGGSSIQLPFPHVDCSLGIIYHEIAHLVNFNIFQYTEKNAGRPWKNGHEFTFKRAVIKVYVESRQMYIEKAMAEAEAEVVATNAKMHKDFERGRKKFERQEQAKARRQSPEHKIEQARLRIKRLESRIKRFQTLLKSARRSLGARERAMAVRAARAELPASVANSNHVE